MQRLFFIHIPKTAGTSFREMLRGARPPLRCYPGRWRLRLRGGRYPDLETFVAAVGRPRSGNRVYAGHYPYALRHRLGNEISCGVFLREPVTRALSNLLHLQRHSPRFRELGLEQLMGRRSVVAHHLCNLQTRFLQDIDDRQLERFRRDRSPPDIDLESALSNLQQCEFVGITERFDDSVRLAENVLQVRLPANKLLNRDPAGELDVSADLLAELAAMNQADRVLYEAAGALLDKRLKQAPAI